MAVSRLSASGKKILTFSASIFLLFTLSARAQSSRPSMTDINAALNQQIPTLTFDQLPLEKAARSLADSERCNIVVNWPALQLAGLTRQTPISLSLRNTTLAETLHALTEIAPTSPGTHLNYTADQGVIVLTTTAELGKGSYTKVFDISQTLSIGYDIKPDDTQHDSHAALLLPILQTTLQNAGESLTANDHAVSLKNNYLAVTQSPRGLAIAAHILQLFAASTRIGEIPEDARLSAPARKTNAALITLLSPSSPNRPPFHDFAKSPHTYLPDVNVLYLPGTTEELAKEKPALSYDFDNAGTLLLGPATTINSRLTLAIYDLRPLLKREAFRNRRKPLPPPADLMTEYASTLKQKIPADWTDLGKSSAPSPSITPYAGLLIIFAPNAAHRAIVPILQDLYK